MYFFWARLIKTPNRYIIYFCPYKTGFHLSTSTRKTLDHLFHRRSFTSKHRLHYVNKKCFIDQTNVSSAVLQACCISRVTPRKRAVSSKDYWVYRWPDFNLILKISHYLEVRELEVYIFSSCIHTSNLQAGIITAPLNSMNCTDL